MDQAIKRQEDKCLADLRRASPLDKSSHADIWKLTAIIHVAGLDLRLSEGDVVAVFSQFGDVIDVALPKEKPPQGETAAPEEAAAAADGEHGVRSRGWARVSYADSRSSVLAVDNMNSATLCGRRLLVTLCREHSAVNTAPSGAEGHGLLAFEVLEQARELARERAVVALRAREIAAEARRGEVGGGGVGGDELFASLRADAATKGAYVDDQKAIRLAAKIAAKRGRSAREGPPAKPVATKRAPPVVEEVRVVPPAQTVVADRSVEVDFDDI